MLLKFTKMHGLGNDFVVINTLTQPHLQLSVEQIQSIAERRFGIGCDQVLFVGAPLRPGVDFSYRIFNADGGEVEQCGNGARCFARYVRDKALSDKNELVVETASGIIRLYLEKNGLVRVNMGEPVFEPEEIPFEADEQALLYSLEADDMDFDGGAVSMGNPHFVMQVKDVEEADVEQIGPLLEEHPRFPKRANIGFMQVLDPAHIRLRVYERGAGETLACGTGACAAVVIGRRWGILGAQVDVVLPGGKVSIEWGGEGEPVWMTGPAVHVFEGEIEL